MPKRLTEEEFKLKASIVHNNKFTYDKVTYINNKTKVTITCPKHGDFTQIPNSHLLGNGCKACAGNDKLTVDLFVEKAKNIHSSKFVYDLVTEELLVTNKSKVLIKCPIHGVFKQGASNHLSGDSCPRCSKEAQAKSRMLSTEDAILKIKRNSSTTWDFTGFKYEGAHKQVELACTVHGKREIIPNDLFQGHGCSDCVKSGFNYTSEALLYYLKVSIPNSDKFAYKIGITNKTVENRYLSKEQATFEVLATLKFETGRACRKVEQAILTSFSEFRYTGVPLLDTGNTELFIKDILPYFRNKKN